MQKWIGIGNLTKDVELSTTQSGIAYARFTLAVARRFANNDGERETDFLNIVVWRNLAENCAKYLKKGKKCCVVGSIQTRNYDAQDGTKRYVTEIVADEVEFLSPTSNGSSNYGEPTPPPQKESTYEQSEMMPIDDSSLPF